MNELERIKDLEGRLDDVEKALDKICRNTGACGYTEHEERRHEGESPIDKLKKGFE